MLRHRYFLPGLVVVLGIAASIAIVTGKPRPAPVEQEPPPPPLVEVRLPSTIGPQQAAEWCSRKTIPELVAIGLEADGSEAWRLGAEAGAGHRPGDGPPAA